MVKNLLKLKVFMNAVKCTQGSSGPGFCSPQDAIRHGKKEKIMYVVCINPNYDNDHRKDYLATVDIDPNSATYCQVIQQALFQLLNDN